MDRAWHWNLVVVLGVSGSVLGCKSPVSSMFGGSGSGGSSQSAATTTNPITRAWKSTTGAIAGAVPAKPKTSAADEAISLGSKPAKISASTRVASGRLLEGRGDFAAAQAEYEAAIKDEPTNLTALVSLARLQDRQGRSDQAIAAYQTALKAHPKSALVHNDLGLCYAKNRDLASAVAMLHKAVELEPAKPNYRNNLATVLVEAGRTDEALQQLQAVHAPATAEFNLAYLLNHRGQSELAKRHLAKAVQLDPSFAPAQEMLARLNGSASAPADRFAPPQIADRDLPPAQGQDGSSASAQSGPYGFDAQAQSVSPQNGPSMEASPEPVYHIGNEGIQTTPSDGPSLYQPTSHEGFSPPAHSPTSLHLDDDNDEEVLVVTHLVYGADLDPAPEPLGLVDDNGEEADGAAVAAGDNDAASDEPTNVKPVTKVPTLQPIGE